MPRTHGSHLVALTSLLLATTSTLAQSDTTDTVDVIEEATVRPLHSLTFDGGTLGELATQLDAMELGVNIITTGNTQDIVLPSFSLDQVDADQVMKFIEVVATPPQGRVPREDRGFSSQFGSVLLVSDNPISPSVSPTTRRATRGRPSQGRPVRASTRQHDEQVVSFQFKGGTWDQLGSALEELGVGWSIYVTPGIRQLQVRPFSCDRIEPHELIDLVAAFMDIELTSGRRQNWIRMISSDDPGGNTILVMVSESRGEDEPSTGPSGDDQASLQEEPSRNELLDTLKKLAILRQSPEATPEQKLSAGKEFNLVLARLKQQTPSTAP